MKKIGSLTVLVVADAGRCRLFHLDKNKQLAEFQSLLNADARQAEVELVSDRPGRSHDRKGSGRHAMAPRTSAKETAAKNFAKRIAAELQATLSSYRSVILVASPAFLGLLRNTLDETVRAKVSLEIDKDLTYLGPLEIQSSINEVLENS